MLPAPGRWLELKVSAEGSSNLKFQCLLSSQVSFGEFVIHSHEEFPERSTNSILTTVTHPGNGDESQVSQDYMVSRLPMVGLDASQEQGQRVAAVRPLNRNGFSAVVALGGDRFPGVSHHQVTRMVARVGTVSLWQWQSILLSAPFTGPILFLSSLLTVR